MELSSTDYIFLTILLGEAVAFFYFYSHAGAAAIYRTWYAWIIDLLAIMSGSTIMLAAVLAHNHPELFNFEIPRWAIFGVYMLGGWQALIHSVKWYLRDIDRHINI